MRKVKRKRARKVWQLQEAKAKFSKVVDEAIHDGYQVITRNGRPVVVVVSQKEFEQYQKPEDTLIDFFSRAPFPDAEIDLTRDKDVGRDIDL
jgi:prevent-host-death family protein